MKNTFVTLVALAGAQHAAAAVLHLARSQSCCFGITASGTGFNNVPAEQYTDGQIRLNQTGLPGPSSFCLANGGLTDSSGRGCVVSPPTDQVQCDTGATPSTGFSVGTDNVLSHNGSTTFYACPTGQNGGYNIYTAPVPNQQGCETVTLTTTGGNCNPAPPPSSTCPTVTATCTVTTTAVSTETCYVTVTAPCATSAAPPPPPPTTAPPPPPPTTTKAPPPPPVTTATCTTTAAKSCPTSLTGSWQFPHLIVPVNASSPNTAYGTSYFGTVSSSVWSVFNFDIPSSYAGETCSVIFLFPEQSQLTTSSYTLSGSGDLEFHALNGIATQSTTFNTLPGEGAELASIDAQPGNSYLVSTGACAAGQTISILVSATGSYSLRYFQDYNPSPIGLYITAC